MITYRTLSLDDLKKDYSDRHGFIFQAGQASSDRAIQDLCNTLIQHNITEHLPEFVIKSNNNTTIYVYPSGESFKSGEFFQKAQMMMHMGVAKVDTLMAFLREN